MNYVFEFTAYGIMYLPNVMKISISLEEILMFCFRNFRGSNVGITGGMDLQIANGLRCHDTMFHGDRFRN
jgi:hypothetical protein